MLYRPLPPMIPMAIGSALFCLELFALVAFVFKLLGLGIHHSWVTNKIPHID
jgi:hypothetical protein